MKLKFILPVAAAFLVLFGVWHMVQETTILSQNLSKADISANPSILNNKKVSGDVGSGLVLENTTIRDTTFVDFTAEEAHIKNVTFENCVFLRANFKESTFENVTFNGGRMSYREDPSKRRNRTNFDLCTFLGVVTFDGVKLESAYLYGIHGMGTGALNFKNMHEISTYSKSLSVIIASDIAFRIDNCVIKNAILTFHDDSTVYATNSTFTNSGFGGSRANVIYVENCKLLDGSGVGTPKLAVMKNSSCSGASLNAYTKEAYFINTQFPPPLGEKHGFTVLGGGEDTKIFIDGNNAQGAHFGLTGGNVSIRDLNFSWFSAGVPNESIASLNLKNVTIAKGNFEDLNLQKGRWEQVKLYPPIRTKDTKIENVQTRYMSYPQGPPWVDAGGSSIKLKDASAPFEWPEVHVPTPAELGLVK